MADEELEDSASVHNVVGAGGRSGDKMFTLKKWNAVAMWSWDVECDTCAICRVQVMDACLRCQAENKQEDCVGLGALTFLFLLSSGLGRMQPLLP
ncbi:RING-box protein 2 isoform X2 [Scyliorhinus canicula]|uniref:RING-box protein 2 isoform X2 n=1 Tax=Scyliorhinus canicula TaxID=7830 RepID=UPI0018F53D25|nr:RING-box protein 2 isoform X2 [Scyliorhinus canicula]